MYQLHFASGDAEAFRSFVKSAAQRVASEKGAKALFHMYNDTAQSEVTDDATAVVREIMPDAAYVGCSSSGNICDGAIVEGGFSGLSASCAVFEDPRTQFEVHQFPFTRDNSERVAEDILRLVADRPWVKAIEVLTTLIDSGMSEFCAKISTMRDDVVVFGGAAITSDSVDLWTVLPYVFSSAGRDDKASMVLVLYGGEPFHACEEAVYGWKPLGPRMEITRARGAVLYELDGVPAFERYHHYLSIEDDENFSENSIIFPLAIQLDGRMVIKAPARVDDDGSMTLTSDLAPYHRQCRITYGDPATILRSIKDCAGVMQAFAPQAVMAFSCAARLLYWGREHVSRETLPFQGLAPTFGLYTGSEFSRESGKLLHHNVTLVVVGLREGDAPPAAQRIEASVNEVKFSRQMAIVNSLASFVGVTSSELEEAYWRMELMARTDGLTGVLNRRAIEGRIEEAIELAASGERELPCVLMLDIDDFKRVNDEFGHNEGDGVLKELGALMIGHFGSDGAGCSGRWGGEEFMALLPEGSIEEARDAAERFRAAFGAVSFPASGSHTVSIGVAQALPGESADSLSQRVDKALYEAKGQGKNRVCCIG